TPGNGATTVSTTFTVILQASPSTPLTREATPSVTVRGPKGVLIVSPGFAVTVCPHWAVMVAADAVPDEAAKAADPASTKAAAPAAAVLRVRPCIRSAPSSAKRCQLA